MLSDHGELADAAARAEARKCEPHEEKAGFILRLAGICLLAWHMNRFARHKCVPSLMSVHFMHFPCPMLSAWWPIME